ncbi:hypothetical protein [Actinotalea fermentans]|uniref:hypothetical protein n=1 Tax=Actinotalea fermentans TaxID=43671 RepID=UPI0011BEA028|nr:hypothetical protein [Actinotalea fermentans]
MASAGPAAAAPRPGATTTTWEESCTDAAARAGVENGLCSGTEFLYIVKDSTGRDVQRSEPLRGNFRSGSATPPGIASRQQPGIGINSVSPDMDSWCDSKPQACTRIINDYTAEAKNNWLMVYNGQNYAAFSVAIRVNLNGRSPRVEAWYDSDSGGAVRFTSQSFNCVKDQTFDGTCGHIDVTTSGTVNLTSLGRYTSGLRSFAPLTQSDDYWVDLTGRLGPAVDTSVSWGMTTVRVPNFNCFGTGNCYFP